jgi:hypothetical protein
MPEFMAVHRNMTGLTKEDLEAAHQADVAIQSEEDVVFKSAWADPDAVSACSRTRVRPGEGGIGRTDGRGLAHGFQLTRVQPHTAQAVPGIT